MTETSWPGDAPAVVAEAQFEQLMSHFYTTGVVGDAGDLPLVYADSTGLQVKLRSGRYAKVRGFTWYSGDEDIVLPIAANTSGQTRRDMVVLELDRSTWEVRAKIVQGAPGGSTPSLTLDPGPTGVWQLWVARVTVANNASTISPNNLDTRTTFIGPPLLIASGNELPDPNVPDVFLRYRPDQNRLILHTGGAPTSGQQEVWLGQHGQYADSGEVTLSGSNSNWETTFAAVIRKVGPVVFLRVPSYRRISGNLSANTNSTLPGTIPSSMRHPNRDLHIVARTTGHNAGRIRINRNNRDSGRGRMVLLNHAGLSTNHLVTGQDTCWLVP